jgi:penicillin amidase
VLRRVGLWGLATVLALVLVTSLAAAWTVGRPFPDHDGEITLPGLSAPVTVHRDAYGIPQIYAATAEDLFSAQGFVHAQDRFWEMDFRRHVTAGRLAELFGEGQAEADAFLRTLGWRRVAETEWGMASAQARRYLTAYADGVNAWIAHTGGPAATGRKSLHYRLLGLQRGGYEVEPWQPVDTLAWLKAMAWDLRTNVVTETNRALLLAGGLSREQVDELYPEYPYRRHDPIVSGGRVVGGEFVPDAEPGGPPEPEPPVEALTVATERLAGINAAAARVPPLLGIAGDGLGSNSWVVSGNLTTTGAPMLANDPHLGVSMPGIWYQMGLHCDCGYRVSGFTFSGVPGVVIGHNERIAWGFTNLGHDVSDLYLERLDGDRYEVDGQWRDLEVREETIAVAGGEDLTIRIRHTHHGPLLSDVSEQFGDLAANERVAAELAATDGAEPGVSLAWTALRPSGTIEALFTLNQAGGWEEFRAAAAMFEVPAQNLIYADVDGAIGYQAPGLVPVRGKGDGRWPAPGWDSGYDWQGFLPFDQLPYARDPGSGMVVTANQAVIGPQYQPWLTWDWSYGYRSDRISDLLAEAATAGPLDVDDLVRIQLDDRNGLAGTLVPALLAAPTPPLSRDERAARDLLRSWDHRQPAGGAPGTAEARSSAAAAYFNAVWRHLLALLFDELPEDVRPNGRDRWFEVVTGLLAQPESPWWDRIDTAAVETRDDVLARALAEAYQQLAIAHGDDPAAWRWGELHTLTLRDATFGSSGIGPVEALVNRGPVAVGGGGDLVNATTWDAAQGYEVTAGPSMRMVVDMSELDNSRWAQTTGNSGHPYHRNYDDQVELWRTGGTVPWRFDRASIEQESTGTLTLRP